MSKWLSIELSLLLLVSLVAFAGFVSWQNTGDDLTGEAWYRPYRPPPKPIYVPPPQPAPDQNQIKAMTDRINQLYENIKQLQSDNKDINFQLKLKMDRIKSAFDETNLRIGRLEDSTKNLNTNELNNELNRVFLALKELSFKVKQLEDNDKLTNS